MKVCCIFSLLKLLCSLAHFSLCLPCSLTSTHTRFPPHICPYHLAPANIPLVLTFSHRTGYIPACTLVPSVTAQYGQFSPTSINGIPSGQVSMISTYTAGPTPITLPSPSFTNVDKGVALPNGSADSQDMAQAVFPASGCVYPEVRFVMSSPAPAMAHCCT